MRLLIVTNRFEWRHVLSVLHNAWKCTLSTMYDSDFFLNDVDKKKHNNKKHMTNKNRDEDSLSQISSRMSLFIRNLVCEG